MLNHFLHEIIMYYNYFSKGHNVGTTFVHPFPALQQTFNIAAYGEKSQNRVICSHYHNVKSSYHYNDQILYKVTLETNIVFSL